jgi:hypothetical protein
MSFCCGASMIGTTGSIRQHRTMIHRVPILFCPICHRVEVHYLAEHDYELVAQYAKEDQVAEVDFADYMKVSSHATLFENCVHIQSDDPIDLMSNQIDMALDLLQVAKALDDVEWEHQLINRLKVISAWRNKMQRKKLLGGLK